MGMPCVVNSILKLKPSQNYPQKLIVGEQHVASKQGYRIFPLDVPIALVDEHWMAYADIVIEKLTWHEQSTDVEFIIKRLYDAPFSAK